MEPQFSNTFQNRVIHSNALYLRVASNKNFKRQVRQTFLPLFHSWNVCFTNNCFVFVNDLVAYLQLWVHRWLNTWITIRASNTFKNSSNRRELKRRRHRIYKICEHLHSNIWRSKSRIFESLAESRISILHIRRSPALIAII